MNKRIKHEKLVVPTDNANGSGIYYFLLFYLANLAHAQSVRRILRSWRMLMCKPAANFLHSHETCGINKPLVITLLNCYCLKSVIIS